MNAPVAERQDPLSLGGLPETASPTNDIRWSDLWGDINTLEHMLGIARELLCEFSIEGLDERQALEIDRLLCVTNLAEDVAAKIAVTARVRSA